jgi:hypothetical protein
VADWSVLDLVAANGTIERIATPHAPVNLWNLHKITPNSKGNHHSSYSKKKILTKHVDK